MAVVGNYSFFFLRNQGVISLVWLWWIIDLVRFEFESGTVRLFYLFTFVRLENRICLSRDVQVAGAAWRAAMRIVTGIGDLVQRIEDGRTGQILGGRAIEKSGGAVCSPHRARGDEEREFFGWASKPRSTDCEWFSLKTSWAVSHRFEPQNQWRWFSPVWPKPVVTVSGGLASKPPATVSTSLASKPAATVCEWFGLKITRMIFVGLTSKSAVTVSKGLASKPAVMISIGLASKPAVTVSSGLPSKPLVDVLVEPQNQGDGGFPRLALKIGNYGLVICASKSPW
jgi:hypothetical protein